MNVSVNVVVNVGGNAGVNVSVNASVNVGVNVGVPDFVAPSPTPLLICRLLANLIITPSFGTCC